MKTAWDIGGGIVVGLVFGLLLGRVSKDLEHRPPTALEEMHDKYEAKRLEVEKKTLEYKIRVLDDQLKAPPTPSGAVGSES